jgi:hypothetical protein
MPPITFEAYSPEATGTDPRCESRAFVLFQVSGIRLRMAGRNPIISNLFYNAKPGTRNAQPEFSAFRTCQP